MMVLPDRKEVWRYLQPSGYNTSTWRTDTGRQQRPRLRIASHGKNARKTFGGRPEPAGELTALPEPPNWWGGDWMSLPKTPTALALGPAGLGLRVKRFILQVEHWRRAPVSP